MVVPIRLAKATVRTEPVACGWLVVETMGRGGTVPHSRTRRVRLLVGLPPYGGSHRSIRYDSRFMHPELQESIDLHEAIVAEAGNALVGYDTEKALANVVLLSEIPTTYDKDQKRQVNAGNLLLRGVPGVGKTFFGVILAAISNAKFARLQGRADLQPTEIRSEERRVGKEC